MHKPPTLKGSVCYFMDDTPWVLFSFGSLQYMLRYQSNIPKEKDMRFYDLAQIGVVYII